MKPFQTILFGADFSEGSREAFRAACSLAVAGQTRLHVLHVIEPHWVPEEPVPYGQTVVEFYDAKDAPGRDEMLKRRMREMYAPNVPIDVEYHLGEGDAAPDRWIAKRQFTSRTSSRRTLASGGVVFGMTISSTPLRNSAVALVVSTPSGSGMARKKVP